MGVHCARAGLYTLLYLVTSLISAGYFIRVLLMFLSIFEDFLTAKRKTLKCGIHGHFSEPIKEIIHGVKL